MIPTSWQNNVSGVLDRLDEIIDRAYFVPLAPADALALQLKVETLKGLPLDTVVKVFEIMDDLDIEPGTAGGLIMAGAAESFFSRLANEHPRVLALWSRAEATLYHDPAAAFRWILEQGQDLIHAWLADGPEEIDPSTEKHVRQHAMATTMGRFDLETCPDDLALRRYLRNEVLIGYLEWARPGIYLDCWADYVRAVMDLSPSPELKSRWPY